MWVHKAAINDIIANFCAFVKMSNGKFRLRRKAPDNPPVKFLRENHFSGKGETLQSKNKKLFAHARNSCHLSRKIVFRNFSLILKSSIFSMRWGHVWKLLILGVFSVAINFG